MILFRQTSPARPFAWEPLDQPPARWHDSGEGPVRYFATTPDGAWAEFLRHEEITDPEDLEGIRGRAVWVVERGDLDLARPDLPPATLTGGLATYPACRAEARRLRDAGASGLRTVSAALPHQGATLCRVDGGEVRDRAATEVVVLFGPRPDLAAMLCAVGRPDPQLLERVNPL